MCKDYQYHVKQVYFTGYIRRDEYFPILLVKSAEYNVYNAGKESIFSRFPQ